MIAQARGIPYSVKTFSPQCYRKPIRTGINILDNLKILKENYIFYCFGNCFKYNTENCPKNNNKIYRIDSSNCSEILLGSNDRYQSLLKGSFFLTPYLAIYWKAYLIGNYCNFRNINKSKGILKKWFSPIEKLILIDSGTPSSLISFSHAKEFSEFIQKPLFVIKGDLEFLNSEYLKFCSVL